MRDLRSLDEPLSSEQVAEFARLGFLVLDKPQIIGSELKWCREILMRLIKQGTGRDEGRNFDLADRDGGVDGPSPQMLHPSLYATQLREISVRKTAMSIARQLLGRDASFAGDHAILKPSYNGGPTPWHQDEAFRDPNFDYKEISIWIALDESTIENGAMKYIPGSHLLGVLPHRLYGGSKEANCIECFAGFDANTAAVRPIRAGSMIIHDARTLHGASGNTTGSSRLAYIIQYSTPPIPRKDFREFPWLKDLRKSAQKRRQKALIRGGIFAELLRILHSDRYSHQHFLSGFLRRRVMQICKLLVR